MSTVTRPLAPMLLALTFAVSALPTVIAEAATITVTTDLDFDAADGFCSLREAIVAANDDAAHNECPAGAGPDRIVFSLTTPATITLAADLPTITEPLLIRGPGPAQLVIDGADLYRLLFFDIPLGGGWLGVERLTLYRGRSPGGGNGGGAWIGAGETAWFERVWFVENHSANAAGGLAIGSAGSSPTSATVVECLFLGNVAEGPGGGGGIGLIGTNGVARVVRSTLALNEAAHENGTGGGILNTRGTLFLEASTVSGNTANASGGGVMVLVSGVPPLSGALIARDSTIVRNLANADVGDTDGDGGGIAFSIGTSFTGTLELHNSVVAGNLDQLPAITESLAIHGSGTGNEGVPLSGFQVRPDLDCDSNVELVASGFSFVGSNEGCDTLLPAGEPNAAGDYVGTAATPLDPVLDPLADYGGPTPTHRPSPPIVPLFGELGPTISPLIDFGSCPDAIEDQRGYGDAAAGVRRVDRPEVTNPPDGDGCDIGAVEAGADPQVDRTLFADGFEAGHTLLWTTEVL